MAFLRGAISRRASSNYQNRRRPVKKKRLPADQVAIPISVENEMNTKTINGNLLFQKRKIGKKFGAVDLFIEGEINSSAK